MMLRSHLPTNLQMTTDRSQIVDAVRIEYVAENKKGCGLLAKRSFRKGERIFRESALIALQYPFERDIDACSHCLQTFEMAENSVVRYLADPAAAQRAESLPLPDFDRFGAAVPSVVNCTRCDEKYCSETCRDDAYGQYHRFLCLGQQSDPARADVTAEQIDALRQLQVSV